ncbi:hypothetical protein [Streptosporangium sandarakinum]|uniref:hypothetical protein n=1 Tax=Streptosporangium sandarakinum TaxID=1260955 RepID=UPI003710E283
MTEERAEKRAESRAEDPDRGRPVIEHHRPVDYRLADHGLQREGFTVTALPDGRRVDVSGICPGCGGRVSVLWEYGNPGYKGIFPRRGKREDKDADRPVGARTVCCDCGYVHAERPDDSWDQGCGAFWQVELP